MGKFAKILHGVLGGKSDANIRFSDLAALMHQLGFEVRVRGSHHIFTKEGVEEIVNLQPLGAMAKPYQAGQVRNLILRHKLGVADDE